MIKQIKIHAEETYCGTFSSYQTKKWILSKRFKNYAIDTILITINLKVSIVQLKDILILLLEVTL